jgi:sugar/nucleoside kinase (ribokinase family)
VPEFKLTTGGCALNCCVALRKMGLPCELVTKIGDDWMGEFLASEIRRHCIGDAGVTRQRGRPSAFTFIPVHSDGQRSFIHYPGTDWDFGPEDVPMDLVRQSRICFFSGAMVLPRFDGEPAARVLAEAQRSGAITLLDNVYVDTADRSAWQAAIGPCLPHLDYYIPSESEAAALTGRREPHSMAEAILSAGCRGAVIKLGDRGAYYLLADGREGRVPGYRAEKIVDTTGAGDSWAAGFIAGLHQSVPIEDAIALANATAAMDIQHVGAATGVRCLDEIRAFQRSTQQLK